LKPLSVVKGVARPRILVVDDDLGPRESLRVLLKPDYDIRTAAHGRAALAELRRYRPDLVLLDVKLPGLSGLDVLRRVKDRDPTIEVVMMTAYASMESVKQALTHGAFEYLIKPFSRRDLEDVVQRALLRRQQEAGAAGQLSILRKMSRTLAGQLDTRALTAAITRQLGTALGYDHVRIVDEVDGAAPPSDHVAAAVIRDTEGPLGTLIVDNSPSGRVIHARERELLEILAEYLAVALRNSRLSGQIAETRRALAQIIANAGDAIVSIDAATGRIEGWNPAAERVFCLGTAEAIGRPIGEVVQADDYQAGKATLEAHGAPCAFETTAVAGRGAGTRLAVTLSSSAGRLIAVVRDGASQREHAQRHAQSDKLAALGQLAEGIAHDFNNLLQAILGYTQLMKQSPGNLEFVTRSLGVVETAAIDGAETIRRIQQFVHPRPEETPVPVDLNAVVNEAIAIVRPRWEETQARDRRPPCLALELGEVPPIGGRPAALAEAMTVLILDALDARSEGAMLTITTRPGRDGAAVVRLRASGAGSSGPGLEAASAVVKQHGGEIEVERGPGKGTTLTLVFPAPRSPAGPGRVLLVDDDPKVRESLAEILTRAGHAVTSVASGPAALAAFAPGQFDSVLTNIGMADMNGWELAERLRAADPAVSILLVTGWGLRDEERSRMERLGISRCLSKPVRPEELDAAVRDAVAHRVV
jgi:PAS domain S-box-containing protein